MKASISRIKTAAPDGLELIFKRLYVLLAAIVLIGTGSFAAEEQNANEQTVPKRITVNGVGENPLVSVDFIARAASCKWNRIARSDVGALDALARGDYDAAIEKAQNVLEANAAWWENSDVNDQELSEKNPFVIAEYAQLLAIAYELKGDYDKALCAYAKTYGESSEEYSWAMFRLLYANKNEKNTEGFFLRFCRITNEEKRWISIQNVDKAINVPNAVKKQNDPFWRALWKFRLNCARVVCPELLFVSELDQGSDKRVGRDFYELQKESYEKFVDFVEQNWQKNFHYIGSEYNVEFLNKLQELPYPID